MVEKTIPAQPANNTPQQIISKVKRLEATRTYKIILYTLHKKYGVNWRVAAQWMRLAAAVNSVYDGKTAAGLLALAYANATNNNDVLLTTDAKLNDDMGLFIALAIAPSLLRFSPTTIYIPERREIIVRNGPVFKPGDEAAALAEALNALRFEDAANKVVEELKALLVKEVDMPYIAISKSLEIGEVAPDITFLALALAELMANLQY